MQVRFGTKSLETLANEGGEGGLPTGIARAYRKVVTLIRAAVDERDLRNMKSLRLEKLKGTRSDEHSMRLNDQWRLIMTFDGQAPNKVVTLLKIEDYH
jgi:proteic killer suppression protein